MLILFILTFLGFVVSFGIVADYDFRVSVLCGKFEDYFDHHHDGQEFHLICDDLVVEDLLSSLKTPEFFLIYLVVIQIILCQDGPYFDINNYFLILRLSLVACSAICIIYDLNVDEANFFIRRLPWIFLVWSLHVMHLENFGDKYVISKMKFSSNWSMYNEIYDYENKFLAQKDHMTDEESTLLDGVMVQIKQLPNANHLNQVEYRNIEFEKKIGTGKFGMVFFGNLGSRAVAVKQVSSSK